MSDKELKPLSIPITGKLRTSVDGTQLSEGDFQVLQNMRYTNAGIKSISGMTKINNSALTQPQIRSGIHFVKDEPQESHLLVQSFDSNGTNPKIYQLKTAIPNTGDFEATPVYTENTSAGIGTFSNAPDGCVAYCNGKESLVWGGDEYRCGAFFNYDSDNLFNYNYSDAVRNSLQTTGNTAILKRSINGLDTYTKLLLHMDGSDTSTTFTDSSLSVHTVTANGSAQIDTAWYKFNAASGLFNGTTDYLSISDHTDFDFSSGIFSIDFWMKPTDVTSYHPIYIQGNSIDVQIQLFINAGLLYFQIKSGAGGADAVGITSNVSLSINTVYHIEITENGNNFYMFINGVNHGTITYYGTGSASTRALNYTGSVYIGYDPYTTTDFYAGWLDEFRISNGIARHTANFTVRTTAYSVTCLTYAYLASTRPIEGFKSYIKTANTSSSTVAIDNWDGINWSPVSNPIDSTSVSGKSLAQTGSNTFDSTVTTSKIKLINGIAAYWYRLIWTGLDQDTEIYQITLDAPMQPLLDIWDGLPRQAYSFFKFGTKYTDNTFNVINDSYVDADVTTYVELDSLPTTGYIMAGFSEPQMGLKLHFVPGHVNTTLNTYAITYYWDSTLWRAIGQINDGTRPDNISAAQSGTVTWQAIAKGTEQTTTISTNDTLLYYYKVGFTQTLSADVQLFYIAGIPAPKQISNYKFPVNFHNRLWLCSDQAGERNKVIVSSANTVSVFNGTDTTNFYIGDNTDIIAGGSLYSRYASAISEQFILCKIDETWLIEGTGLSNYTQYRISNQYGCVAPQTFTICNIGFSVAAGITKHVAIWQASNAIIVFDGSSIMPIHFDISDVFDQRSSLKISQSMIDKSTGFFDETNNEWHWCWSSDDSTLNNEYVYDLVRQRWYIVNRGYGVSLRIGISVRDTKGNKYTYGSTDTGYLERLEYGNTFDNNNIISKFRTPDIPITGWAEESLIRKVSLISKTKAITNNKVSITHYGDVSNTSTSIGNFNVTDVNKRVIRSMVSISTAPYTFHSFECSMTTSNEPIGFEPIGLEIFFKHVREKLL